MKTKLSQFIVLFCILTVPLWATEESETLFENFYDQDLLTLVIQELGFETDTTILVDREVKGQFSGQLQATSVESALDSLLGVTEYTWVKTPYYYLVASPDVADRRLEIQAKKINPDQHSPIVENYYGQYPVQALLSELAMETEKGFMSIPRSMER